MNGTSSFVSASPVRSGWTKIISDPQLDPSKSQSTEDSKNKRHNSGTETYASRHDPLAF
tara:strand:- start:3494 stop:3670 length:177 start_codon:yes stop_codon:yes gene_type:complete